MNSIDRNNDHRSNSVCESQQAMPAYSSLFGGVVKIIRENPYFVGMTAGAAESILYPTVVWRADVQQRAMSACGRSKAKVAEYFKFKGYPIFAACSIPLFGIIVGVNEQMKKRLLQYGNVNPYYQAIQGCLPSLVAGAFSTVMNAPEAAVFRYRQDKLRSPFQAARQLYKEKGLRRGWTFQYMRNSIYSLGLNYYPAYFYPVVKMLMPHASEDNKKIVSAGFSGLFAGIVSQGFDWGNAQCKVRNDEGKYPEESATWRKIFKTPFRKLYAGTVPRVVKTSVGAGLVTAVVVKMKGDSNE